MVEITTYAQFEEHVLNSPVPVVVDFHATWCGPCKALAPKLHEWVQAKEGKIKLVKVDVDKGDEITSKHNITAMPTLIFFAGGNKQQTIVGANFANIQDAINKFAK